jgi:putative phosphoribosyl transferase
MPDGKGTGERGPTTRNTCACGNIGIVSQHFVLGDFRKCPGHATRRLRDASLLTNATQQPKCGLPSSVSAALFSSALLALGLSSQILNSVLCTERYLGSLNPGPQQSGKIPPPVMFPFVTQFRDRTQAGQLLADKLARYANRKEVSVLALPRGGVPVAFEVAKVLNAPLDIVVVRKLGVPGHEELAMGAIAPGGLRLLDAGVVQRSHISNATIEAIVAREQAEMERREMVYRGNAPAAEVRDKIVILVDDGLATGSTMRVAAAAVKRGAPAQIVVAVPTAPPSSVDDLRTEVDEVVAYMTPRLFFGVGEWYQKFNQVSDEEVRALLQEAKRRQAAER